MRPFVLELQRRVRHDVIGGDSFEMVKEAEKTVICKVCNTPCWRSHLWHEGQIMF